MMQKIQLNTVGIALACLAILLSLIAMISTCAASKSKDAEEETRWTSPSGAESGSAETQRLPGTANETQTQETTRSAETEKEENAATTSTAEPETTAAETVGETEDADAERTEAETDIFLYRQETDGTCTVIGLRESATDTCIVIPERTPTGEKVTAIAENAFRADRRVTLVQIPATVKTIGKTAFADCPNLAYISVSFGNICYRDIDGVLYSFDGSALLCYPPARIADTVVIGSDVTAIAEMAFYQCKNLLYVQYSGSVDTWSKIEIGGLNNSLTSASITCNSTRK